MSPIHLKFFNTLDVISGSDNFDSTTIQKQLQRIDIDKKINIKDITVGIPKEYHNSRISSEILDTWQYVTNVFQNAGVNIKEVRIFK